MLKEYTCDDVKILNVITQYCKRPDKPEYGIWKTNDVYFQFGFIGENNPDSISVTRKGLDNPDRMCYSSDFSKFMFASEARKAIELMSDVLSSPQEIMDGLNGPDVEKVYM